MMKGLIQFVLIGVVLLAVVGFYRQWFAVTTSERPGDGKMDVHLEVNKQKIQSDAQQARSALKQAADRTMQRTDTSPEAAMDGRQTQDAPAWDDAYGAPTANGNPPSSMVGNGARREDRSRPTYQQPSNQQPAYEQPSYERPQDGFRNGEFPSQGSDGGEAPLFTPPTRPDRTAAQQDDLLDAARPR
ncbi:MAG: hypothetical protein C0478_09470 [Planctomyces sp.]|nr:hypothetical protein [Planctomyces sp.]